MYRILRMAILAWICWGWVRGVGDLERGDRSDVDSVVQGVHIYAPHICMFLAVRGRWRGWFMSTSGLDEVTSKQRAVQLMCEWVCPRSLPLIGLRIQCIA